MFFFTEVIVAGIRSLVECFAEIDDPRIERTRVHPLESILVLAVLAVVAGAEGWEDIEDYGLEKESFLRKFLRFPAGIPSHDTISRVFRMLRPDVFQRAFLDWVKSAQPEIEVELIAIDGKSLRRSHDRKSMKSMLHSVSAWSVRNHLVLAQRSVDEKSNEITAIPKLLEDLVLKGTIVTIDAMGCQKEIAQKIVAGQGDYVLAVKDNQPLLRQAIEDHFKAAHESEFADEKCRQHQTEEKHHGRTEKRFYYQSAIPKKVEHLTAEWAEARSICQVVSITQRDGKEASDVRYYISSLKPRVKTLATAVRGHWGIENSLHWVLDMTFNEDQSRIRKGNGPENFALLRRFAIGIIKQDTSKGSIRRKRKRAAWNDGFLLNLITAAS